MAEKDFSSVKAGKGSWTHKSARCECGHKLVFSGAARGGDTTRCPKCGRTVTIPR